ncbi:MAG: ADP-ribosylglycohydrolase family protein [Candidatus Zixiibacteriota bacterium]
MTISNLESRFVGCVIGQCLGDALGLQVEGKDGAECGRYVEDHMSRWFGGELPPTAEWSGQYTDDSQLARELLDSLVRNNGWVPEDYAERIGSIFRSDKIVGRGIACDQAARQLNAGVSWKKSGVAPPSAGNGTAMRVAPVGLYYHDRLQEMVRVAYEQGWITHHDPRCAVGSIAIAGAVALVISDQLDDPSGFVGQLADWTSDYDEEFSELLRNLPKWVELNPLDAVGIIATAGKPDDHIDGWPGISPFVVPSVLWSLYSFLRHPNSYLKAVSTAIAVGGDVDTTAAMTGALSGAHLGIKGLPNHLPKLLQDQGEWKYADLVRLATLCYSQVCRGE